MLNIGIGMVQKYNVSKFKSRLILTIRVIKNGDVQQRDNNVVVKITYRKHKAYMKMIHMMREKMKSANIYKLNVQFNIKNWNVNSFLGRAAHIEFLKDSTLVKMILLRYKVFSK